MLLARMLVRTPWMTSVIMLMITSVAVVVIAAVVTDMMTGGRV